jgi:hypothetical protein
MARRRRYVPPKLRSAYGLCGAVSQKIQNLTELFQILGMHRHSLSLPPNFPEALHKHGQGSIVVVEALCYKPEGRWFETRWGEWIFSIYPILPAALGTGVYSSNRNEYQKQKNNVSGKPSMSRLSRWYGILYISQSYKPPQPAIFNLLLRTSLLFRCAFILADVRLLIFNT